MADERGVHKPCNEIRQGWNKTDQFERPMQAARALHDLKAR